MSRALGVTEEKLSDLPRFAESDAFTADEKLVCELAVAMTSTPANVSDDLRGRLLARFTKGQVGELGAAIAWENHRSRLSRALGVRPMGFTDGEFCVLPERPREA